MGSDWEEEHPRLRALLVLREMRHTKEIASLLELRLWQPEIQKLGEDLNEESRAECRF